MANINKIRLSGQTYNIEDVNATKTLELTQAEYDALAVKDPNTFYIITDSEGFDLSNYYTKLETDDLLDTKLDVSAYTPTDLTNYYKKSETSGATQISTALASKANKSEIPSLDGYATETWVEGKGYLTEHQDISGKLDVSVFNTYSGSVNTQLNSKASESDLDALNDTVTAHTANTSIHVTSAEKATWNAKSDFSGDYNDLANKPTIPTVPTSNTAFTNDAGYITSSALDGYATTGDVQTATNDMATKTWVGNQGYLTEHQSLSNYYTKSETSGATEISTALASKADTATTYTKTEVDNAITAATSTKQDTLVSGTNIKTINNTSILGSGNIEIQGGGGKSIEAGRGITVTTGETADTVSFNLPISAGTGTNSVAEGYGTKAKGPCSHAEGDSTSATSEDAHSEGYHTKASGIYGSHAEGRYTIASGVASHAEGYYTEAKNNAEHASGWYNVSSSASTTFGDSGNTLFSVGNGTSKKRHNAFEIRQNGDIYITKDGQDVKLQDQLGGGASYSAGTGIDITNNVISVTGKVETSAITTAITSSSTDAQVPSAKAVNDKLGGLSLVKLSQSEYDGLATKNNSTLYVIVN